MTKARVVEFCAAVGYIKFLGVTDTPKWAWCGSCEPFQILGP